jgi:LmbE family N-acetylglucosaminyl deacetylase
MNNELRRYIGKQVMDTDEEEIFTVSLKGKSVVLSGTFQWNMHIKEFLYKVESGELILFTEEVENSLKARDLINSENINPEACKWVKGLQISLAGPYTRVILDYDKDSNRVILQPYCYDFFGERKMKTYMVDPSKFCNYINKGIFVNKFEDFLRNSNQGEKLEDKKSPVRPKVEKKEVKEETKKEEKAPKHKRILILNVHPDDDVLAFGGLLAKAKRNGDEVFMHTFCVGGPCSNVSFETRLTELMEVSEFFGIKRSTYDDRQLDGKLTTIPSSQITGIIDELIRDLKPDEVYCSPYSEHVDHKALYEAFMGAARLKEGWMPKLFAVGCYPFSDQLYQAQVGGKIFQPMTEEDFNMKIEGFRKYKSQFKPAPSPLSDESLVHQSKYYGMLCGAPYAELYYQLRYIRSI